ncbi:MAG: hypothetical protein IK082_01255 [Oscillospiraceae bacterium]|nr:hypothetical protein [Oscillospiraceae bacterium]
MKPLSPKTLEKKYAELGLPRETTDLLHVYFRCFAHLYGVISVRDAWDVFRNYEGLRLLHKKDFVAFSGIAQREAGHPYAVLELKEVYTGETTEDPAERLIADNRLIRSGYGKYTLLYNTVERQGNRPYYLPDDRASFLAHAEDRFFQTPDGREMVRFLGNLKTGGFFRDFDGVPRGVILGLDGRPVERKRLSDITFYTRIERFDIDYYKDEAKKEKLRREYATTALEKILKLVFIEIQTGGYRLHGITTESMQFVTDYMTEELGVEFTEARLVSFLRLYADLNNHSNLWMNCGWRPDEMPRGRPGVVSIGPGLQKMFEEKKLDRTEFERRLGELGLRVTDD